MMARGIIRVGKAWAERWEFSRSPSPATRDARPPMTSSPIPAARCQYLLGLLAQVPDPRKKRGRRHPLAGLLAAGIAVVIAGSRSFAAIGQWAADADPEVLAGAGCGPRTCGRIHLPARIRPSQRRRAYPAPCAWCCFVQRRQAVAAGDCHHADTPRGAKSKNGKAPHLVAALAHGIGAVLGQVAVDEKTNEIPGGARAAEGVRRPGQSRIDALCRRRHNASVVTTAPLSPRSVLVRLH